MSDYISESEALSDWEDDNCVVDDDDCEFIEFPLTDSEYHDIIEHLHKKNQFRFRRNKVNNKKIQNRYKENINTCVGNLIKCPICGTEFVKKVKQQKFCCIKCKNKYHNKRQVYY